MDAVPKGFCAMVPAIIILVFAWTLSGVTNNLGAKVFVAEFVRVTAGGLANFLPAIVFLIALFLDGGWVMAAIPISFFTGLVLMSAFFFSHRWKDVRALARNME